METTAKKKREKKNSLPESTSFVLLTGPFTENPEKPYWKIGFYNKGFKNQPKYHYTVYSLEKGVSLSNKIAADQNCEMIHHQVQLS